MNLVPFDTLKPGDAFVMRGIPCVVMKPHEECKDLFGREMSRFWAYRADTGAEGWVMYGPGGVVEVPT